MFNLESVEATFEKDDTSPRSVEDDWLIPSSPRVSSVCLCLFPSLLPSVSLCPSLSPSLSLVHVFSTLLDPGSRFFLCRGRDV